MKRPSRASLTRIACRVGQATLLIGVAGCFTLDDATGIDNGEPSNDQYVTLLAIGGSGAMGQVYLTRPKQGAWLINASVHGPITEGTAYPMHLHAGKTCDRVGAAIATDLGAPVGRLVFDAPPPGAYLDFTEAPRAQLTAGYYFDVHAAGDAAGRPIGCAVFLR